MELLPIEKEIINDICSKKITDVLSFATKYFQTEPGTNNSASYMWGFANFNTGIPVKFLSDPEKTRNELLVYLALVDKLSKLNLITVINRQEAPQIPPYFIKNQSNAAPAKEHLLLILEPIKMIVFPSPELGHFIKNNYNTKEEMKFQAEEKDRKTSQFWTIFIALLSIGISTVISVGTAIFNYKTYTNERKVTITNALSKDDTLKIKLLSIDSVLINKNK